LRSDFLFTATPFPISLSIPDLALLIEPLSRMPRKTIKKSADRLTWLTGLSTYKISKLLCMLKSLLTKYLAYNKATNLRSVKKPFFAKPPLQQSTKCDRQTRVIPGATVRQSGCVSAFGREPTKKERLPDCQIFILISVPFGSVWHLNFPRVLLHLRVLLRTMEVFERAPGLLEDFCQPFFALGITGSPFRGPKGRFHQ
jgi:hypothetical protein